MTRVLGIVALSLLLATIAVRLGAYFGDGLIGTIATLALCMPLIAALLASGAPPVMRRAR